MTKRVAILIRSLANGGAEKQAVLLATTLAATHRVRLQVVSREPCLTRHVESLARHGLQAEFLPANPLAKPLALARWLRRERVDVLFTFLPSDTVLGALVGRWAGVPRIIGGLRNTGLGRIKVWALRFVHNHVLDATISNSQKARELFARQGFAQSRLLFVPNGIEVGPAPAARPRSGERRLTVLTVARFVEKKDHRTALRSVAHAMRELAGSTDLVYRLVGYGPLEERLRDWIRAEGLGRCTTLMVDPPQLEPLWREADVYLCSSRHEGLSNSILEAMNHGLPVVATNVGDTAWMVRDGQDGILAQPGDWQALGRSLVQLAQHPDEITRMGASAHERVAQQFSCEAFGRAYRSIVDEEPARAGGR